MYYVRVVRIIRRIITVATGLGVLLPVLTMYVV